MLMILVTTLAILMYSSSVLFAVTENTQNLPQGIINHVYGIRTSNPSYSAWQQVRSGTGPRACGPGPGGTVSSPGGPTPPGPSTGLGLFNHGGFEWISPRDIPTEEGPAEIMPNQSQLPLSFNSVSIHCDSIIGDSGSDRGKITDQTLKSTRTRITGVRITGVKQNSTPISHSLSVANLSGKSITRYAAKSYFYNYRYIKDVDENSAILPASRAPDINFELTNLSSLDLEPGETATVSLDVTFVPVNGYRSGVFTCVANPGRNVANLNGDALSPPAGDGRRCTTDTKSYKFEVRLSDSYNHRADFTGQAEGDHPHPAGGSVSPGRKYSIQISGWNTGAKVGQDATLIVENKDPGIVSNEGSTKVSPSQYQRTGFGFHEFYWNPGQQGICSETGTSSPACWGWLIKDLPNNGEKVSAGFSFEVSNSAAQGDEICFDLHIKPRTESGGAFSPSDLCFDVVEPRKPEVRVEESDVHAGAVLSLSKNSDCSADAMGGAGNDDDIRVNNDNSKGEYAVSATGDINKFGSNNESGNNTLKFNNNGVSISVPGSYTPICRPDYSKIEPTEPVRSATQISQSDLANGVIKYDLGGSGTLNVYNPININQGRKTTVIVDGDVRIRRNINYANSYDSREQIPSFAIIATGSIYIDPTVSRIDGLYVANETFDTCSHPSYGTTRVCSALQLTVNGAVAAKKIDLKRKGLDTNSIGERFRFLPELYLSQPPSDNNIVDVIRNSQMDLPPVF
jgi:hypothetical protein